MMLSVQVEVEVTDTSFPLREKRTLFLRFTKKVNAPRSEKIGSLLNSYLICISRKVLGQVNRSLA